MSLGAQEIQCYRPQLNLLSVWLRARGNKEQLNQWLLGFPQHGLLHMIYVDLFFGPCSLKKCEHSLSIGWNRLSYSFLAHCRAVQWVLELLSLSIELGLSLLWTFMYLFEKLNTNTKMPFKVKLVKFKFTSFLTLTVSAQDPFTHLFLSSRKNRMVFISTSLLYNCMHYKKS